MVGLQDKELGRLFEEGGQVIIVGIIIAILNIYINIHFIVMTNSSSIIAVDLFSVRNQNLVQIRLDSI